MRREVVRALLVAGLLPALPATLAAQGAAELRADADSAAIVELVALEHHLNGLLLARDWEAYGAHVAEDYRQTNRRGEVRGKADVLEELRNQSGAPRVAETTPDSITVRVYGNAAVLQAVLVGRNLQSRETTFRSRILKVFIRKEGRWYLVAMQGTPLP